MNTTVETSGTRANRREAPPLRKVAVGAALVALAALVPAPNAQATPDTTRSASSTFRLPSPSAADDSSSLAVEVTAQGAVEVDVAWEPAETEMALVVSKRGAVACTGRGARRVGCTVDVTREEIAATPNGVLSVEARVLPKDVAVAGTLVMRYPVPPLTTDERIFVVPGALRSDVRLVRPGPLLADLSWSHEPGEEPQTGDDIELVLQVREVTSRGGLGPIQLVRRGKSPLHLEQVVGRDAIARGGMFQTLVTTPDLRAVVPATAVLRITYPNR